MSSRIRKLIAVVAAIAILALAVIAGLLSTAGDEKAEEPELEVAFPRDHPQGRKRVERPADKAEEEPAEDNVIALPGKLPKLATREQTALQRAVAAPDKGYLVFEVGAIGHSELARKIMACRARRFRERLDVIRKQTGLDIMEDVEQVGMSGEVVALGGRLQGFKLTRGTGEPEAYGDSARIRTEAVPPGRDGKPREPLLIARVGPDLVLVGSDRDKLLAAIDRAEGRAPSEPMKSGRADVRGRLSGAEIGQLMGKAAPNDEALKAIRELTRGVDLRMNVEDHVALSLDLGTEGVGAAHDLSASLKSAVTIARQLANREGHKRTAWLLDQARFHDPGADGFAFDLAVPGDFVLMSMGCTPGVVP